MAGSTIAGPKIHWLAYFWPGLPQLWTRGSWAGLLVAVGFTALANVLLLATLVFSEWLTVRTQLMGYGALTLVWLLARWQSRAERRARLADADATSDEHEQEGSAPGSAPAVPVERDELFREAQGHYLRNDWVATEQLLLKLLKQDARDVESRLMLATLWRHQGRGAEATRQLDRVARLEAAEGWLHEIAAERLAIEVANEEVSEEEPETQTSDETNSADGVHDDVQNGNDHLEGEQRRAA